jgi:hypothetical protein
MISLRLASPVFSPVIIMSMHVIYNLFFGYRFELLVSIYHFHIIGGLTCNPWIVLISSLRHVLTSLCCFIVDRPLNAGELISIA